MVQKRVLVADDDADNRVILQAILDHAGFAVLLARNGEEAFEKAREHRPGLILMDLMMPGTDGWEALRRLKADPATAPIPVIAFTAEDAPSLPGRLREAGFCAYLRKPYPPRQVLEAVRICLDDRSADPRWIDLPLPDLRAPFSR